MHENSAALGHQAREPSPEDRARVAHYVISCPADAFWRAASVLGLLEHGDQVQERSPLGLGESRQERCEP